MYEPSKFWQCSIAIIYCQHRFTRSRLKNFFSERNLSLTFNHERAVQILTIFNCNHLCQYRFTRSRPQRSLSEMEIRFWFSGWNKLFKFWQYSIATICVSKSSLNAAQRSISAKEIQANVWASLPLLIRIDNMDSQPFLCTNNATWWAKSSHWV